MTRLEDRGNASAAVQKLLTDPNTPDEIVGFFENRLSVPSSRQDRGPGTDLGRGHKINTANLSTNSTPTQRRSS